MQRYVIAAVASIALLSGCARHSHSSARAAKRAHQENASSAATQWLELLDDREYEEAYDREPARVRAGGTTRQFVRSMTARRAPFGRAVSRRLIGTASSHKLTGAPDGDYVSVLFKTSFQHKSVAAERVILLNDRGTWRVVDYRLY